jgi:hypothetical protein
MSIILATQVAEIGRIEASPGKTLLRPYLENTHHKIGLVECLKV